MKQNEMGEHYNELEKTKLSSQKLGTITIALIFGLFGFWSIFAQIQMTITAGGTVITHSYNKIIMHPHGGIVKKMFVREGEYVKNTQPLLELDNNKESFELSTHIQKHDTNIFTLCRLQAQSNLNKEIHCDKYKKNLLDLNQSKQLEDDAKTLFRSNMKTLSAKIDLYNSKNDVLKSENKGLEEQIQSQQRLLTSYQNELKKWMKLLASDAVDELKIIDTQRKIEQTHLQISTLKSKTEENYATMKANEKQIKLEKESFINTALTQFNELLLDNKQTLNTISSLKHIIQNTTLRAPSDGLVTDMQIHTSGEVVIGQNQIMTIVPNDHKLIIEAYVDPSDIEKLYKGQEAEISFPAFVNPSAIPIEGKVTNISADTVIPEGQETRFYLILVEITEKGLGAIKHNQFKIIPGMQTTVFVKTNKTTLMRYLTQPVIQMFKGIYHAN